MSGCLSLDAVSAAVQTALDVPALVALAPGGVWASVPEGTAFPLVLFEVGEAAQWGGFGSRPGVGMLPEVDLRIRVFAQTGGIAAVHGILAKVLELLADPPTVAGYRCPAIIYRSTSPAHEDMRDGRKVQAIVADFSIFVEATP